MLQIVAGDPDHIKAGEGKTGASYTRFVLPFAYDPVTHAYPGEAVGLFFDQASKKEMSTPEWMQRRRYFTPETEQVLYDGASWFVLKEPCGKDQAGLETRPWRSSRIFHFSRRSCKVEFARAGLVLFEWGTGMGRDAGPDASGQSHFFKTGFLLLDCHFAQAAPGDNWENPTYEELLAFNELFRYWRRPYDHHFRRMADFFGAGPVLPGILDEAVSKCGFEGLYLGRWLEFLKIPLRDADGKAWRLFPDTWFTNTRRWWRREIEQDETGKEDDDPHCMVYMDDRTFVQTCALVNDGGANFIRRSYHAKETKPEEMGHWVKLLNVDYPGDDISGTTSFEQEWCRERTYRRWEHYGALYGFNYHSTAMLSGPISDPPTWDHYRTLYADMILLMVYMRVTLFRFSRRLSLLSQEARGQELEQNEDLHTKFKGLRRDFMLFTNLYQFPLISNQQQAIEIYSKARRWLDVDDLFREMQQEVNSTHEFLEVIVGSSIQNRANLLARWGLPAALVGLLFGFFALGKDGWVFPLQWRLEVEDGVINMSLATQGLLALLAGLATLCLIHYWSRKSKGKNHE